MYYISKYRKANLIILSTMKVNKAKVAGLLGIAGTAGYFNENTYIYGLAVKRCSIALFYEARIFINYKRVGLFNLYLVWF